MPVGAATWVLSKAGRYRPNAHLPCNVTAQLDPRRCQPDAGQGVRATVATATHDVGGSLALASKSFSAFGSTSKLGRQVFDSLPEPSDGGIDNAREPRFPRPVSTLHFGFFIFCIGSALRSLLSDWPGIRDLLSTSVCCSAFVHFALLLASWPHGLKLLAPSPSRRRVAYAFHNQARYALARDTSHQLRAFVVTFLASCLGIHLTPKIQLHEISMNACPLVFFFFR